MSKVISYNLPGYGFANCFLFGEAISLMDLLESYNLIEKTKNVCQLGTMKYVYPGAHHTRYEYIFTQLMLISNIVTSKGIIERNIELSLSASLNEYDFLSYKISGGEIMQCLAILSNASHMYDTFTSSKLLLRLLQESRSNGTGFYIVYKRNLSRNIQPSFDELLNTNNYYKLHLFNMCHLLKGMAHTSANSKLCDLCIYLVEQLINAALIKNEATKRIFLLYKKIRKLAYLSVDMIYTPASFGANLSRMIYSISSYIDDLFNEDSSMNQSIYQLEDIIHRQIYDSAKVILNLTRIEQESYKSYYSVISQINNIYDIRDLIIEEKEKYASLHSRSQPKALKQILPKSELLLSGNDSWEKADNVLNFDDSLLTCIPNYRVAFGTQISQNLERVLFAFALIASTHICEDSQIIIAKSIEHDLYRETEKVELVKYAIMSIYKYGEFFFNLYSPTEINVNDCVIIGRGCKNIANKIKSTFTSSNIRNNDELHEIISCATVLENITYTGIVMCFVGGIKARKYNETKRIDELDGFIYFPTRKRGKTFAVIVEAKNYINGENDAVKQLNDTRYFLSEHLSTNIKKLEKCAYMELSLKDSISDEKSTSTNI